MYIHVYIYYIYIYICLASLSCNCHLPPGVVYDRLVGATITVLRLSERQQGGRGGLF